MGVEKLEVGWTWWHRGNAYAGKADEKESFAVSEPQEAGTGDCMLRGHGISHSAANLLVSISSRNVGDDS